jgi:protein O-GlcNAc transferase
VNSVPQTYQLALQYHQAGNLRQAELLYQQILQLAPRHAGALHMLGVIANQVGKHDTAIEYIQQALRLRPGMATAHNNLGSALRDQGKLEEAIENFREAIRLQPAFPEAHNNLGIVLRDQRKFDEAIASFQQALRLKPDYRQAFNNLAIALKSQGNLTASIGNFQHALRLNPNDAEVHSNLIFSLHYHPDYDSLAIYQEAQRWNDRHAEPLGKYLQPHTNPPDRNRRLRIGYVSPDFRDHCQSFFTIPLLSNHDHSQTEIFCYADDRKPDAVTQRHRGYVDVWRSTVGHSDQQVAELIRSDQIDILVDLTMHMAKNRLLVFARKPAPVQVTWLAYPGTTGIAAMDYRLTDPYLDPPGEGDACYTEQSIRLPDTFWCYDPLTDGPPVNDLPALTNGFITFGCLNNFCKVNDAVVVLWARVLRAVPHSRLLMLAPTGQARGHVLEILRQEGIDDSRVEFFDKQPRQVYLHLYHQIDLGLDLLPYNGHTTSLDAFWMGVPTTTLIGKTVAGRAGWSQLCNLGLQELAARTPEEYVEVTGQLAGDLSRLKDLRAALRARLQASPLMDGKRFARHMEESYRRMWTTWCDNRGKK